MALGNVTFALQKALALAGVLLIGGCTGANVAVESTRLPVPVIDPLPISVGIHLSDELKAFTHQEAIRDFGTYTISVGPAQNLMFNNLATGMFARHRFVERGEDLPTDLDAVLVPSIKELQFSIPQQTKSDFFEVWLKYDFRLLSADGTAMPSGLCRRMAEPMRATTEYWKTPQTVRCKKLLVARCAMRWPSSPSNFAECLG